jgi:lipopolysaccharide/colanic/teichoic acid biosynthesis glycosyltransferase
LLGYRELQATPVPIGIGVEEDRALAAAERIAAALMLAIALPVLAAAGAIIVLLSRRAPLVAHERVGRDGRALWVLKLRTMWGRDRRADALWIERLEKARVPAIKPESDPRVTSAFAALCRKFSIDELPQLWHVVRGEMSLVGPRPLTAEELAEHYGPAAAEVLRMRPGLTGLWQVKGRSSLNYPQRRRLDLFLVRKWSWRLYFAILAATVPRVLTGKDAW